MLLKRQCRTPLRINSVAYIVINEIFCLQSNYEVEYFTLCYYDASVIKYIFKYLVNYRDDMRYI
jgi:hypothetical protein